MAANKLQRVKEMSPGVSAFLVFIGATLAAVAIWMVLGEQVLGILKGRTGGIAGMCAYIIIIAVCCFILVKRHPNSVWYVPLIANLLGIISAFTEPQFWKDPMIWVLMAGGFVLSVIASAIGALRGKKQGLQTV